MIQDAAERQGRMSDQIAVSKDGRTLFAQNADHPLAWWSGNVGIAGSDLMKVAAMVSNPTRETIAAAAGMAGTTALVPLMCVLNGMILDVPDRFVTTYQEEGIVEPERVGIVGPDYTLFGVGDLLDTAEIVRAALGGEWSSAGRLREGRIVFCSIKLPESIRIPGDASPVQMYVNVITGLDGSFKTAINVSPVRAVCMNTVRFSIQDARLGFQIRHTAGHDGKLEQAMRAIAALTGYMDRFEIEAAKMSMVRFSKDQFAKLTEKLYPGKVDTAGKLATRTQNVRDRLMDLHTGAQMGGSEMDLLTQWSALNAITQYEQHEAGTRVEEGRSKISLLLEQGLPDSSTDRVTREAQTLIYQISAGNLAA